MDEIAVIVIAIIIAYLLLFHGVAIFLWTAGLGALYLAWLIASSLVKSIWNNPNTRFNEWILGIIGITVIVLIAEALHSIFS